ncbi:WAT1-related protein At1g21890-like [Cynara cardunculus var. scolymus]|uniref:WAT1-related protein n=1 Tax=Cynara cardunculus var. scolymus TaxID=59895 RepID=A0A103XTR6_CYNCS|nr:WAT1-related protein At1g21890-like [Cynara cardunculus var. scolymus]KVH96705.1 Drug/metabolite transporter [Cynara cardunculus var. scolymus]
MGSFKEALNSSKPYLAMVALQFGYAGMYIITMIGMKRGLSHWILVVYRHATATLVIAPFALAFERKIRPKLTRSVLLKVLLLGLLEPVIDQNLYFLGMTYTSATYASAIINVLPALTFIMALVFGMEKVNLKRIHSQAKIAGTVITVTGATVMTLYKGPIVDILWYSHHGAATTHKAAAGASSSGQHMLAGTIMILACTCSWSAYFIVQSMTLKEYPAELSLTSLICLAGTVEGGIIAMIMERDPKAWALGFDSRLLASVYSGVICSGIAYYVQGVVNRVRGPVFVTAFSPLCMIITAVLGAIVLSEQVHLGSLLGAIIIVMGLYSVVWGKSKDHLLTSEKSLGQELPTVDKHHAKMAYDTTDAPFEPVITKDKSLPQEP